MGCTSSAQAAADSRAELARARFNQARRDEALRFRAAYDVGDPLGRGSTAEVYAARRVAGEKCDWGFAVKVVELQDDNPRLLESIENEFELWRMASQGKHVVQLVEKFHEPMRYIFVAHRCEMELITHLWNMPQATEATLSGSFAEMLTGLDHVHSLGIAHRDLKPDNFLVDGGVVKISDFGLARLVAAGFGGPGQELEGIAGTAPFMPPEMIRGEGYGLSCDLWSMGVVAYVLLLGRFPYEPRQATPPMMKQAIADGQTPPTFQPCRDSAPLSEVARAFLQSLLRRDPARRVDAKRALTKPYITNSSAAQSPLEPALAERTLGSLRPALRRAMRIGACSRQPLSEEPKAGASTPMSTASTSVGCGSSPVRCRSRTDSTASLASTASVADGHWQRQYSPQLDSWLDHEFCL